MHINGKCKKLQEVLNESGLDGLESVSNPNIGGDSTYEELCQMFPKMSLMPNFPANLSMREYGEIRDYINYLKETAKKYNRPLMLQVSEDLPPEAYETAIPKIVRAMYE